MGIKSSSTKHGVVLGSFCSILCGQYCTWYGIQICPGDSNSGFIGEAGGNRDSVGSGPSNYLWSD